MSFTMPFGQPAEFSPAFALPEPRPAQGLWLVFRGSELLVSESDAPAVPSAAHPSAFGLEPERELYLGTLDTLHC